MKEVEAVLVESGLFGQKEMWWESNVEETSPCTWVSRVLLEEEKSNRLLFPSYCYLHKKTSLISMLEQFLKQAVSLGPQNSELHGQ